MYRFLAVLVLLALFVPVSARATTIQLTASLDAAQAGGTASDGSGTATVFYDDVTRELSWTITYGGLSGPATNAHFHGPARPGETGGVQVIIPDQSTSTDPYVGSTVISAAQAVELLNEQWYINIHTANFPSGEIRGQVLVTGPVDNDVEGVTAVKARYGRD